MRDLNELNKYRDRMMELSVGWEQSDERRSLSGCFVIPAKNTRKGIKVIASSGQILHAQGWDHVSVSLPNRCPTWEEMDRIKRMFFHPDEVCMQLHPAESNHVSNHPYCLHIWRNVNIKIPLPPANMVGVASLGSFKPGAMNVDMVHQVQDSVSLHC